MLRIRLSRRGKKKDPHYRVVVAERSSPRDGRFVEIIGYYNPADKPVRLKIDTERADYWVSQGAQPSGRVEYLLKRLKEEADTPAPEEATEAKKTAKASPKKAKAKAEPEPAKEEAKPEEEPKEESKTEEEGQSSSEEAENPVESSAEGESAKESKESEG